MSKSPYFHCNKNMLKFWQDFDLLPYEFKQMLFEQNNMPTEADVKAAWEMVQESGSFQDMLARVNCLREKKMLTPEEARKQRQEEKRKKEMERLAKQRQRQNGHAVFKTMLVMEKDFEKKQRLVTKLISVDEYKEILHSKDKQNYKIVNPETRLVNRFVGFSKEQSSLSQAQLQREQKEKDMRKAPEKRITTTLAKSLHNAGG